MKGEGEGEERTTRVHGELPETMTRIMMRIHGDEIKGEQRMKQTR